MKKMSRYKKTILVFFLLLLVLQIDILCYVYNSLVVYEKKDLENFLNNYLTELQIAINEEQIDKYAYLPEIKSPYENSPSFKKGYKELLKNKKLNYKKTKENNKYDIYADNRLLFTILLDNSKTSTRLGLLKITDWRVSDLTSYNREGLYSYDLYVTSDEKITINGTAILDSDLVETKPIEDLDSIYKIKNFMKIKHYRIQNLSLEPEIKIYDSANNIIKPEYKDNAYYALNIKTYESLEEVKDKLDGFDPIKVLKTWSLLLSNDTSLNNMSKYLIPNSDMYKRGKSWVDSVDRWFTPAHYYKENVYSNQSVKNITFYGDDAFSLEVKLTKTIYLSKNNEERIDQINEKMFFLKDNGNYKLVDMKSMGE